MISDNIALAADILRQGGLVAIPTETVYGLAANIYNQCAVKAIFETKQRPLHNPLIVHVNSIEYLGKITTNVPPISLDLAEKFWPGPLTLLLEKNERVSNIVTAGNAKVAVRVPDHPVALSLLNQLDFPLAAPSANPFGSISPSKAEHVEAYFTNRIEMVLQGGSCKRGIESTIVGFEGNQAIVYRMGSLSIAEIESVAGKVKLMSKADHFPVAPGMLSKHYAPNTPLILSDNIKYETYRLRHQKVGMLLFSETLTGLPVHFVQKVLSPAGKLAEAASNLYDAMHQLDKLHLDYIIAEQFPEEGLGAVINDKLGRAAFRSSLE